MRILITVALIVMASHRASAQSQDQKKAEDTATAPANLTFAGVSGTQAMQFVLDATKDQKTGTAAFGWHTGEDHFQLAFSGPLDDSTGETAPLSLLGLPAGATAKFSFSRLSAGGPNPIEQKQIIDLCAKHGLWPPAKDKECRLENIPPDDQAVFAYLQHLQDPVWLVGGDLSATRSKFSYLTKGALDSKAESHQGWSATARLGRFGRSYGFLIGSYTYKRSYKAAGAASDICSPIEGTASLRCQSAVIGAPTETIRSLAAIELRRFFRENLAITPSVQYDFKNDVTGVDVPIYFIGKGTNALGGIRFGWRSDTEDLTAVAFVGASVGLLPR